MKIKLLTVLAIFFAGCSYGQNTFTNTGTNVGIGTTSPLTLFNVVVPISKTGSGSSAVASFLSTNDFSAPFGLRSMIYNAPNIVNRYVTLQTTDYGVLDGGSIILQPAAGNVGIGTTAPLALLDVGKLANSGDLTAVLSRLTEGNTSGAGTYLGVRAYDTQASTAVPNISNVKSFSIEHSFYGNTNSSINFLRGTYELGGSISFNTNNNSEKMRILYNGYVGIGTATPDQMLSVKGTIHSQAVLVDMNGWNDYVFQKDYHLRTLSEVEKYINDHHHLPEVPSESEIVQNGLDLGKIDAIQTKKIEELTLYLIEKDEQVRKQQQQINDLKLKMEQLLHLLKLNK